MYILHGLPVENMSVPIVVELLKFIMFDGIGEFLARDFVIYSYQDKWDKMAATLLKDLCKMLVEADLPIETQLMVLLVCSKEFEPSLERVIRVIRPI